MLLLMTDRRLMLLFQWTIRAIGGRIEWCKFYATPYVNLVILYVFKSESLGFLHKLKTLWKFLSLSNWTRRYIYAVVFLGLLLYVQSERIPEWNDFICFSSRCVSPIWRWVSVVSFLLAGRCHSGAWRLLWKVNLTKNVPSQLLGVSLLR